MQVQDGRQYRLVSAIDDETLRFEQELLGQGVRLCLPQEHPYLRETPREYRLFQVRDPEGRAAFQAVVYLERSRLYGGFAHGIAPKLGPALNGVEEAWGLRLLRQVCAAETDCMTLRLQPVRTELRALLDFEASARRAGFHLVDPIDTTRTLFYDIKPTQDALLEAMTSKTRGRFRHKGRELVEIRAITGGENVARCREAENASRGRTQGGASPTELSTWFKIAEAHPDRVLVSGVFLKSRPAELMAFSLGIRHGTLMEYVTAGSFQDPELRAIPFNAFLMWDLVARGKQHGAELLDLGGVTDGGPDDRLAGISEFKRSLFPSIEAEVGREMLQDLRPFKHATFRAIQALRSRIGR